MKKILAFLLCAMMVFALPVAAEETDAPVEDVTEEVTQTPEDPDYSMEIESGDVVINSHLAGYFAQLEAEKKAAEEAEKENTDDKPYEKPEAQIEAEQMTEKIVAYVQMHLEEISVIVTMILTVFYQIRKHASLNKSIVTLNNNSVSVAENSAAAIGQAATGMGNMCTTVGNYATAMDNLMAEIRANEEEKRQLVATLAKVSAYLESAKLANVEFSNELAELLILANIPNSKKDELYARHLAAVDAIAKATIDDTAEQTEVKEDVERKA